MAPRIEDMNAKDEEGIDREAWRQRLGDVGEPAPITDLRIRAEARRAVTPRIGHWWLPASLAASLVLAVFVVQWQIADDGRAPVVRESDMAVQDAPAQAPAYIVVPPPMEEAPSPAIDLPAMEAEANAPAPAAPAAPAADQEAAPAADDLNQITVTGTYSQRTRSNVALRTPEQWYADIEALRAAGRNAEADAELERLEKAYPGWLERRQPAKP